MSKGLIIGLIIVAVFVVIIIWDTTRKNDQVSKITANPKQTICKVVGRGIPKKSSDTHYGVWIDYEYAIEGKTYKHQKKYYFPKNDELYFNGMSFPLIYCVDDPDLNRILIIDSDFEEFHIQQPDSLKRYNGKIY